VSTETPEEKPEAQAEKATLSAENAPPDGTQQAAPQKQERPPPVPPKPGVSDMLSGDTKEFNKILRPYLPQELVGGSIPNVPGMEDEAVWNAASQACGTEKVNFCYSVADGRIWYLACPAQSLSSNPDTWCPLAAALPGNSEFWDRETVYLFEHEGIASALRWDPDTGRMQVFLGASRTILPRVQSMDANFVTIDAQVATIVPWKNKALKTEKLSRATLNVLTYSGIIVSLAAIVVLLFSFLSINFIQRDLNEVKFKTDQAAMALMKNATNVMQSDAIKHMVRIQQLLDGVSRVNGTLVRYEVKKGKIQWEALIPPAFAQEFGKPENIEEDGRARVKGNR